MPSRSLVSDYQVWLLSICVGAAGSIIGLLLCVGAYALMR